MNKVVLISSTPPPMGGIAKWTERMLKETLPDGWHIVLVNDKIVGKRVPFGDHISYDLFAEFKRWTKVWKDLYLVLKDKDIKVVHACPIATKNSMLANIVSAFIARLCNKKMIIHFRCTVPNLVKTKMQHKKKKVLCSLSNQIIVLNSKTLRFIQDNTNTSVVLIPNFVDADEVNKAKLINEKLYKVLYVGGVTKEKGCDALVEIAKHFPDIEFHLVGKASSEIEKLAQNTPNIIFGGVKNKNEVIEEYNDSDLFVFNDGSTTVGNYMCDSSLNIAMYEYMRDEYANQMTLRDLLTMCDARLISDAEYESNISTVDFDLSLNKLSKDTLINLLAD